MPCQIMLKMTTPMHERARMAFHTKAKGQAATGIPSFIISEDSLYIHARYAGIKASGERESNTRPYTVWAVGW